MATKLSASLASDWRDVAGILAAFEAVNNVRLEIRMTAVDYKGSADIRCLVVATDRNAEIGEVPPLGSVSATCSAMNLRNLEAVLIQLLYLLDGQLARQEFASEDKKQ